MENQTNNETNASDGGERRLPAVKTIEIGSTNLALLTAQNLIDIAKIEGVHRHFDHWGEPIITDFRDDLFSDTLVVNFAQTRIRDGFTPDSDIELFFDFKDLTFHYHFKHVANINRSSSRARLQTIKYLIENGFDVPIY